MSSRSIVSASNLLLLRFATWLALAATLIGGAASASAEKKRIVVIDFEGAKADRIQRDVEKVLARSHSVVPGEKYDATAAKMRASKPTDKNVAKVARRLNADGVLIGSVTRKGSRYHLKLQLREGRSGAFVATVELTTRKARLSASDQRAVKRDLFAAIDDLAPITEGDDDDDDEADDGDDDDDDDGRAGKGKKGKTVRGKDKAASGKGNAGEDQDDAVGDDDGNDERTAKGKVGKRKAGKGKAGKGKRDDDDDNGATDDGEAREVVAVRGDDDDDDETIREDDRAADRDEPEPEPDLGETLLSDAQRTDMAARSRGLAVAGGLSVIGRRLSFSVSDNLANAPQGYKGSPVAGAYVTADLFPLAFSQKNTSITRDLGIIGTFEQVIKIESRLQYTDDAGTDVTATLPTTQWRYGVGVVYRHNFGARPSSPTLKVFVRYNRMKFAIDRLDVPPDRIDIPNTDYTFVDPGLGLRLPLSATLALVAEGRFLYVTSTGEMGQPEQYGSASVIGGDGDVSLEYRISPQLFARVGGRVMSIGFTFDGTGALTTGRDGDDATIDVGGARDTYFGGYGLVGYLF